MHQYLIFMLSCPIIFKIETNTLAAKMWTILSFFSKLIDRGLQKCQVSAPDKASLCDNKNQTTYLNVRMKQFLIVH